MSNEKCIVSVVMPNYNTPIDFLKSAIDSILLQTYKSFEFIIIDDCSNDGSYEYLRNLKDPRIRVFRNKKNLGITKTLNIGFDLASGEYIARMDSDDIALPNRLEVQLAFMKEHPEVIVCGTWVECFGDENYFIRREMPEREFMRCSLVFGNIYGLVHPTAFFRKNLLLKNNIRYDEELLTAQDYAMWVSCADVARMACVQCVLLKYRIHGGQVSISKKHLQSQCTKKVYEKLLKKVFQRSITDYEMQLHENVCDFKIIRQVDLKWLDEISKANMISKVYRPDILKKCINFVIKSKAHNEATTTKNLKNIISMLYFLPINGKFSVIIALIHRIWVRLLIVFGLKRLEK